jgi:hypothetical protein
MGDNSAHLALVRQLEKGHVKNDPPVNVRTKCPYCGGHTMVAEGGMGECRWCGAPISPEDRE